MENVITNSKVKINYTGKFDDGEIFDSSLDEGRNPLEVTLGGGQLIKGFEAGLIGMSIGEKKTILIEPEDAYGNVREDMFFETYRNNIPPDATVGSILQTITEGGAINARIIEIGEELVKMDANHFLAGKKLIFDVEVLEIN